MRIRSTGLALFAGVAIFVAACSSGAATPAPATPAPTTPAPATAAPASVAPSTAAESPSAAAGKALKVGLVTDVGTLEDKSFNEASWLGAQAGAKNSGGTADNIVTKAPADYAANIQSFVDQGYDTIVTVGFAMGDATAKAAAANPNIKFIGVDQFPAKTLPNYQGLIFKEQQAGYLAGILAASLSKTGVIGTVGGINTVPPVVSYIKGYENGAKSVNPAIQVLEQYVSTDITKAFNDVATGKAIALQMLAKKADVIFQVAGLSGTGAVEAACAANVLAIGVDVDQWESLPNQQKCIVSSAEKKLVNAVTAALGAVSTGTDKGGAITWDASTTPAGVGLADYHDLASLVTPDIQALIDKALAGMKDGSVDPCKPVACDKP